MGEKTTPNLSTVEVGGKTNMLYDAVLNDCAAIASLEPGATHAFTSRKAAIKGSLKVSTSDVDAVELGNGSAIQVEGSTTGTLYIDGYLSEEKIYILHMPEDVDDKPLLVIGRQRLAKDNPRVD